MRLQQEEEALSGWKDGHEARLMNAYNYILEREDWDKYSNCQEGYLNVRNENELNGFISDFKDKCDSTFISNFKFVEKDFKEEMNIFDESQLHYHNLERLRIQGRATLNQELEEYAYKYLRTLYNVEGEKIESLTKYFVENFHLIRQQIPEEKGKPNDEIIFEYVNPVETNKLGYYANNNNQQGQTKNTIKKFDKIDFIIREVFKLFVAQCSLLRFYWSKYDIREYFSSTNISPYINIGGCFFFDPVVYPDIPVEKGTWLTRNSVGENYKNVAGITKGNKNIRQRITITLPKYIFTKDLNEVEIGVYNPEEHEWITENKENKEKSEISFIKMKENDKKPGCQDVDFNATVTGIFGIIIKRKLNYPYKSWKLRCIERNGVQVALIDLESKITSLA